MARSDADFRNGKSASERCIVENKGLISRIKFTALWTPGSNSIDKTLSTTLSLNEMTESS